MVRALASIGFAILLSARILAQAPDSKAAFDAADVHPVPATTFGVSMSGAVVPTDN